MVLILYDIADDRIRNKIADCCLDYGLERIQYSAFQGQLRQTVYEELLLKLKRLLNKKSGIIQGFRLCQKCQLHSDQIGQKLVLSIPKQGVLIYEPE